MSGENLDLSSDGPLGARLRREDAGRVDPRQRPYLGIQFGCCGVYARIYVNRSETAYEGHCPRCSRPVRVEIGPGGTDCRFFKAW